MIKKEAIITSNTKEKSRLFTQGNLNERIQVKRITLREYLSYEKYTPAIQRKRITSKTDAYNYTYKLFNMGWITPHFYLCDVKGKNGYSIVEARTRTNAILDIINNKQEIPLANSKKIFWKNLSKEEQNEFLDNIHITVFFLPDATPDEELFLYRELNAGKHLSKNEKIKALHQEDIVWTFAEELLHNPTVKKNLSNSHITNNDFSGTAKIIDITSQIADYISRYTKNKNVKWGKRSDWKDPKESTNAIQEDFNLWTSSRWKDALDLMRNNQFKHIITKTINTYGKSTLRYSINRAFNNPDSYINGTNFDLAFEYGICASAALAYTKATENNSSFELEIEYILLNEKIPMLANMLLEKVLYGHKSGAAPDGIKIVFAALEELMY